MQTHPIPVSLVALWSLSSAVQAQNGPLFETPQAYAHKATDLVVAEFNGDGIPDFAHADLTSVGESTSTTIELGRGDGTFASTGAYLATGLRLASADFNHDGLADVASAYYGSGTILLNQGGGTFGSGSFVSSYPTAREVVAADFDGDTWADVAFATPQGQLSISLNAGGGVFPLAAHQALTVATSCVALASGDLDGDGDVDLAVLDGAAGQLVVLLDDGAGTFAIGPVVSLASYASSLVVADFTGDGLVDVALAYAALDRVTLLRNAGAAQLVSLASFNVGNQPADLVAADWNLDGVLDLATTDELDRQVTALLSPGASMPAQLSQHLANSATLLASGDFDRDGRPDLLAFDWQVFMHRGHGDGTFEAPDEIVLIGANDVAAADLDGDGDLDLAVSRTNPNVLSVLTGDGAGAFVLGATQGVSQGPEGLALGDLDGDAVPDAVTANPTSHTLSVLLGLGNATFGAPANVALPSACSRPVLADLDGDGHLDVAVTFDAQPLNAGTLNEQIAWLAGDGHGGLGAPVVLSMGAPVESVAVADLDGDGDQDLVSTGSDGVGAGYVEVRLNQGSGAFGAPAQFPAPRWVFDLALGDMDLDGDIDAVVVGEWHNNVSIFANDGTGAFAVPAFKFELGGSIRSPRLVDVDRDGDLDMVCGESLNSVLVALNGGGNQLTLAGRYAASGAVLAIASGDFDGDGDDDLATATRYVDQIAGGGLVSILGNQAVTSPATYCSATVNSLGCTPSLSFSGRPSVSSAQPFVVSAANLLNQKAGLLFYGFGASSTPYLGGTFCVAPPVRRTGVANSGGSAAGNDCSGAFAFDFNAYIQSGVDSALTVGERVFAQHWSRDPGANPHFGWTDAIEFRIAP